MKEVTITFDGFFRVVRHLVERLTKNAIRRAEYTERTTMSLLLFVDVIGIDKPELEEVLSFFSGGSDRYDYRTVDREAYTGAPYRTIIEPIKFFTYRYQNDNEIIIDIYDVSDVRTTFIRDLYENLRSIANNDYKRSLFEKFVQKTKTLKTLGLIYNTETPLKQGDELRYLFHEVTNLRSEFGDELFDFGVEICSTIRHLPKLVNNEDKYYEGDTEGKNTHAIKEQAVNGGLELSHKEVSSRGGAESNKGNRKLEPKVEELVVKFCKNKTYEKPSIFYEDICNTLEQQYLPMLKQYSGYKRYLIDKEVDWHRTIIDWCRKYMRKHDVKVNIQKNQKNINTNHKVHKILQTPVFVYIKNSKFLYIDRRIM